MQQSEQMLHQRSRETALMSADVILQPLVTKTGNTSVVLQLWTRTFRSVQLYLTLFSFIYMFLSCLSINQTNLFKPSWLLWNRKCLKLTEQNVSASSLTSHHGGLTSLSISCLYFNSSVSHQRRETEQNHLLEKRRSSSIRRSDRSTWLSAWSTWS